MADTPERVRILGYLGSLEGVVVILASPLLLFPLTRPAWTIAALAALLLVWLAHWASTGQPGIVTPLNIPLLALLIMMPVAVWVSPLPGLTLPKLAGSILGVAVFRVVLHTVRKPQHLTKATAIYLALGLALAMVGLVSTDWLHKWPVLDPILERIPRLGQNISGVEAATHPNQLASVLLLLLPVSLSGLGMQNSQGSLSTTLARLANLLIILFFGAVLVLTQSRGAWIGVVAGLGAMAWLRWPRLRWPLVIAVFVSFIGVWYLGPRSFLSSLWPAAAGSSGQMLSTVTLDVRIDLWNRALHTIQDFPFTGCGLGTFRQVVQVLYPLFRSSAQFDIGHAHNILLQMALDLGLPGMVAYMALVGTSLWIGWKVAGNPACRYRWLGLGIVGALVAYHVYGLTDSIALGAKHGIVFWLLLALAAALWNTTQGVIHPEDRREPEDK